MRRAGGTIRRIADEYLAHALRRRRRSTSRARRCRSARSRSCSARTSATAGAAISACWRAHPARMPDRRARSAGRHARHDGRLVRPADLARRRACSRGPDGFMNYPFNEPAATDAWQQQPHIRNALHDAGAARRRIRPGRRRSGPRTCPGCSEATPKHWPRSTAPDVWFCYRTNPAISSWNAPAIAERLAEFPFTVAFAYTIDETNWMADVLLPEATDIESRRSSSASAAPSSPSSSGSTKAGRCASRRSSRWRQHGHDRHRTELARAQSGSCEKYNGAINRGAAGTALTTATAIRLFARPGGAARVRRHLGPRVPGGQP